MLVASQVFHQRIELLDIDLVNIDTEYAGIGKQALQVIQSMPRLGYAGYGIADAEIYALLGDPNKALDALDAAVESGWRSNWRLKTELNENLASLHGDPRFEVVLEAIRSDMAQQLARVRERNDQKDTESASRPN